MRIEIVSEERGSELRSRSLFPGRSRERASALRRMDAVTAPRVLNKRLTNEYRVPAHVSDRAMIPVDVYFILRLLVRSHL